MEFFEVVEKRGSYRGEFEDARVPEDDIREIVSAGLCAPSGYNMQTTSFAIVQDAALRAELAELLPSPATKSAPVILVAVSEVKINERGVAKFPFEIEDYAAAVENIMLAITAKGYAGVWMDGMTRVGEVPQKIAALLNVPEGKTVRTIIPLGTPKKEVKQREKKPFDERVVWDRF